MSRNIEMWTHNRKRLHPRLGVDRVVDTLPAAIQIVIAALVSYAIARYLVGNSAPVIAVTIVVSSLGFVRDARPLRVLETAIGMTLGVVVSEIFTVTLGQGVPQLAIILTTTIIIARFLSPSASFAVAATMQSAFVAILPALPEGVFSKTVNALIGGTVAILATALIPRDPRRAERRDAHRLLREIIILTESLVCILRTPNSEQASDLLTRARQTDSLVTNWRGSLDSALAIARISPFLRRHLPELRRHHVMLQGLELAVRNLRVIARRIDAVARANTPRREAANALNAVAEGIHLLHDSVDNPAMSEQATASLTIAAKQYLSPATISHDDSLGETSILLLLRPFVVDLLCASGVSLAEARTASPPID